MVGDEFDFRSVSTSWSGSSGFSSTDQLICAEKNHSPLPLFLPVSEVFSIYKRSEFEWVLHVAKIFVAKFFAMYK